MSKDNNDNDKILRDAQYRKGLSIAFFNATNAAVELVSKLGTEGVSIEEAVTKWRNWFLDTHKKYYAEVIANIGVPYDVAETIKRLESVMTKKELKQVWISLSEDERQDATIIEAKNRIKHEKE